MDFGGANISLLVIIGPLLLIAVLVWAVLRNRNTSRRDIDRSETAASDVYDRSEEVRRRDDGGQ